MVYMDVSDKASQETQESESAAEHIKASPWGAYAKLPVALIFSWMISAVVGVSSNAVIATFFDHHSLAELSLPFAIAMLAATIILYGSGAFVLGTLTSRINKWILTVLFVGPMFVLQVLSIFGVTDVPIAEQIQKNSREIMQFVYLVLNPMVSYFAIQKGRESEFGQEPKRVLGIAWQHWIWILPFALYQTVGVPLFLLLLLWKIDFIIGEPSIFELPGTLLRIVVFMILSGVLTAIFVAWDALNQTKAALFPRLLKVAGVWLLITLLEVLVLCAIATKNASEMIEHHNGALKHFDDVIALDSKNSMSHFRKGREYAAREYSTNDREFSKSIEEYTNAINLDPKNTAAYIARGQAFVISEKLSEAANDFTKAISLAPENPTPYAERANVLIEQDQKDQAETDFKKAITLKPRDAESYYEQATAYQHEKDLKRALADVDSAIDLDSNDARFYILRAMCHQKLGDTKRAIADGVLATGCITCREEQAFRERGIEAFKETAYERAVSFLTHAIALEPKKAVSYFYRAKTYEKLGNTIAADKDYEKAASLDKKFADKNQNL